MGFNTEIKRADNGASIWKANELNHLGKFTNYTMGNKPPSEIEFDNFGLLVKAKTAGIQDLYYTFDCKNGNMMQRKDLMRTLEENFTYDASDRLLTATVVGQNPVVTNYLPNGNIDNKTGLGTYTYDAKPNAVVSIENTDNIISNNTQDIIYTSFDRALHLSEGDYTLDYAYGAYDERKSSKLINTTTNQTVCERLYLDGFERTIKNNNTVDITYINTPLGLSAMFVKENGNAGTLYYVYTDNLGSINTLIDDAGNKIEQSFDAWGNKRNFSDWTNTNIPASPDWLYRGYTGHEHLNEFALINMNGRMYDPIVARFLNPDNQVQDPANTQNYNRYSYVMNNPLKYNDPSGWAYIGYQYFKPNRITENIRAGGPDMYEKPSGQYTLDGCPISNEMAHLIQGVREFQGKNSDIVLEKHYNEFAFVYDNDANTNSIYNSYDEAKTAVEANREVRRAEAKQREDFGKEAKSNSAQLAIALSVSYEPLAVVVGEALTALAAIATAPATIAVVAIAGVAAIGYNLNSETIAGKDGYYTERGRQDKGVNRQINDPYDDSNFSGDNGGGNDLMRAIVKIAMGATIGDALSKNMKINIFDAYFNAKNDATYQTPIPTNQRFIIKKP